MRHLAARALALAVLGGGLAPVSPAGAASLARVPNTTLAVPQQPPAFGFALTNAFGAASVFQPVCLRSAPGETNRLFVAEDWGRIRVLTDLDAPSATVSLYLDLSERTETDAESGLLGFAFHPNFQSNGYVYVYRTIRVTDGGSNIVYQSLARYQANPPSASTINTNTEQLIFLQEDFNTDHNAGDVHFGPDGYLYISVADGGDPDDYLDNSQTIRRGFNSGILRLDVDNQPTNLLANPPSPISGLTIFTNAYRVPADNPWVTNVFRHETNRAPALAGTERTEFYAVGLRNPWRMSFDPVTGFLYAGDVGGQDREELDVIQRGANYGWGYREGALDGVKAGQTSAWYNAATPAPWATNFTATEPVLDYGHGGSGTNAGSAIIGGYVYRGTRLPSLVGAYVFGDYFPGNLWALRYDGTNVTEFQHLVSYPTPVAFGLDPRNGDILVLDYYQGLIKRLVYNNVVTGPALPPTLAHTGAFTNLATLRAHAGIVPYSLNVPFWSDNAIKSRWFSVPNTNFTLGFSAQGNWSFPTGMVWIKHFDLVTNHVASQSVRLETRFLVRNAGGVHGFTYRWGGQTNAVLVPDAGTNETFVITDPGGILRTQVWRYPGRGECLSCHGPAAGLALGFSTAQLNRDHAYTNFVGASGQTDNQIKALRDAGYFSGAVSNLHLLPALANWNDSSASLEWRVRSYLMANCSSCHQPGGPGRGNWDARYYIPTDLANLINGPVINNFGNAAMRAIVPGSPTNSLLYQRAGAFTGTRMPPLATSVLDTNNLNLLAAWIASPELLARQTFAQWQLTHFGSTNAPGAAAAADADGDGLDNEREWFLGTDPTNSLSDWRLSIEVGSNSARLLFPRVANRAFEVQYGAGGDGLSGWQPLDVAGNEPAFPAATSNAVFLDPGPLGTNRNYRVRISAP